MDTVVKRSTPNSGNVSMMTPTETTYDWTTQDVDSAIAKEFGNIVALEHANICIPDQRFAIVFYVVGLGLTRDPYQRVGLDNMGINIGRSQLHIPTVGMRRGLPVDRPPQRLRGIIGLVVPDLAELEKRLEKVVPMLADTQFSYKVYADRIEATCPWGNRYSCHAPSVEFGDIDLGLPYIEFDVPRGTAEGIARFYQEALLARATIEQRRGEPVACVRVGLGQKLFYRETDATIPPYDGHHIAISIANYSHPHRYLSERGLVRDEGQQWYLDNIVDVDSGKVLYTVTQEVHSLQHPAYNKALVNRNTRQTNTNRERHDEFRGRI